MVNKKLWLSGVVFGLGLSAATSESFGQAYGPYNSQGLAPNSYRNAPMRYPQARMNQGPQYQGMPYQASQYGRVPAQMTSGPIRLGPGVPMVAQAPQAEHIHVPQPIGNDLPQSLVPSLPAPVQSGHAGSPYQQNIAPSYTAPLPPVNGTMGGSSQPAPMYGVAPQPQYAPTPDPNTSGMMPIPAVGGYGPSGPVVGEHVGSSCSSCNQGGGYGPYFDGEACGGPSYLAGPVGPAPWIVGANALLFRRLNEDNYRLTSDSNMPTNYLLSTNDASSETAAGVEVFGGRYFGCGRYAVVGSYWGLFPSDQTAFANTAAGVNLRSNVPFTVRGPGAGSVPYGLDMPPTNTPVYDYYDGAFQHRLVRGQEYHNAEINLFGFG